MSAAGDAMMPEEGTKAATAGDLPSAHVLLNGLTLHSGSNAARFFIEQAMLHWLPAVWPQARFTLLMPRNVPIREREGVQVHRVAAVGGGARRVAAEFMRLPRFAGQLGADVVVSPHESVPFRLQVPLVVVAQNLLYHCESVGPLPSGSFAGRGRSRAKFAFYRWQMPRAYRRADAVVAVSRHAAALLAERASLDLGRVHVAPCGADRLPLVPRRGENDIRRLVTVGAVAYYKRLFVLVEALGHLHATGDRRYTLVLAGEEWAQHGLEVERHARKHGVSESVERAGPLSDVALAHEFAGAHAVVSLSRCESFGLPVIEGMRAGVPAVVADEQWSEELVGDAAVRVRGDDPIAVADGLRSLDDRAEWVRFAVSGRSVAAGYTWERTAARIALATAATLRAT